jgi:hypothetical protein
MIPTVVHTECLSLFVREMSPTMANTEPLIVYMKVTFYHVFGV